MPKTPSLEKKKKRKKKKKKKTRVVSHSGHAIYIKTYLKAKEELWKVKKYFTTKKYNLQKNPPKKTKILQDIITL